MQGVRVDAGVFERLPARLQHQPLLRVQQLRLDRRNAEERGVELIHVVDQGGEPARLVLNVNITKQLADAPGAGTRNALGYRVLPCFQQSPE